MRMLIYFDWRKPMSKDKVILGFETSCDETAIAIIENGNILKVDFGKFTQAKYFAF